MENSSAASQNKYCILKSMVIHRHFRGGSSMINTLTQKQDYFLERVLGVNSCCLLTLAGCQLTKRKEGKPSE